MNKIAIQLSGQIRYWHKSYNDWVGFKASLEKEGFDVDLHICGWEDEYTKELEYDIFTTSNLIPINKDIVIENSKLDGNWSRNQQPISLLPYSYLQYWGGRFRRLYQKQNNIDYDFIILTRPDVYYNRNGLKQTKQLSHNKRSPPVAASFLMSPIFSLGGGACRATPPAQCPSVAAPRHSLMRWCLWCRLCAASASMGCRRMSWSRSWRRCRGCRLALLLCGARLRPPERVCCRLCRSGEALSGCGRMPLPMRGSPR